MSCSRRRRLFIIVGTGCMNTTRQSKRRSSFENEVQSSVFNELIIMPPPLIGGALSDAFV